MYINYHILLDSNPSRFLRFEQNFVECLQIKNLREHAQEMNVTKESPSKEGLGRAFLLVKGTLLSYPEPYFFHSGADVFVGGCAFYVSFFFLQIHGDGGYSSHALDGLFG